MARRGSHLELEAAERRALERLIADPATPPRQSLRAEIVLRAASGATNREVAEALGISLPTATLWRERYEANGLEGLRDRPRPGRPRIAVSRSADRAEAPRASVDEADERPARTARGGEDEGQVDETVEYLLQAACRAISKRGFASTRVADIADEAGISPATVYYHFKTRHEILIGALLWVSARAFAELERATDASDDPLVRIAKFLERTIPYPGVQEDEYLLEIDLWGQARHHPELLGPYEAFAERWLRRVADMIRDGVAAGSFTISTTVDEVAQRISALTDGLAAQAVIGVSRMPPARVRELVLRFAAEQLGVDVTELEQHASVPELTRLQGR